MKKSCSFAPGEWTNDLPEMVAVGQAAGEGLGLRSIGGCRGRCSKLSGLARLARLPQRRYFPGPAFGGLGVFVAREMA